MIDKNPVYQFPYNEIDVGKYTILTEIEDKLYFKRKNSYNFLSLEFAKYRILRFRTYIKHYHGKEKIKRVMYAAEHYAAITKHVRGYSTIEMQLIRNIGLPTGYNCVVRRKVFEFVYTKIFFCSLKQMWQRILGCQMMKTLGERKGGCLCYCSGSGTDCQEDIPLCGRGRYNTADCREAE